MKQNKNEYFGLMMSKVTPSMEGVRNDFSQIAKNVEIITPMIMSRDTCSPFLAEKIESVMRDVNNIKYMLKHHEED